MAKVILRKSIDKIGKCGDVVSVKDGYARNFLLPNGLALLATEDNIKIIGKEKDKFEQSKAQEKKKSQELAAKLQGFSCTIAVEAQGEELYGSITPADISKALEEEDIKIGKDDVILEQPIKKLGIYEVGIKLHPEISTKIKVWAVKK